MTDAYFTTRAITRLLSQAVETNSIAVLKEAHGLLVELKETGPAADPSAATEAPIAAPNDLYLYTSEAAISLGEWTIAEECINRMIECGTASSKVTLVRTLFCRAAVELRSAEGLRGRALQASIASALGHVMRGIKLALTDPQQMGYLVAHGASHAWNVAWRLFKEGSYSSVANAIGYVVQALEKIDLQDMKTRIHWLMRYGTALAGSGRGPEASAAMQKAADLCASKPNVPAGTKIAVFRAQAAMAKLIPNPKLKQDAAKGTMRGVLAAHSVLCGAVEGPAAEAELNAASNELFAELKAVAAAGAQATADADGKKGGASSASPAPAKGKASEATSPTSSAEDNREDVLAEIALAFAVLDNVEKALEIGGKMSASSKRLRAQVVGDFAVALATAKSRGGIAVQSEACFNCANKDILHDLMAAIHRIDRALEGAMRIPDPLDRSYVVQLGAVLMWNVALPLLQPTTRGAIAKPLSNAVRVLEDVGSNLGSLLVKMNFECGQVDADADYMSKALSRLDRALTCDYVADPEEARLYGMNHPMDRYALWERRRLQLRGNVYHKSESPEDEAIALLEQARDADAVGRISILGRVKNLLAASEPPVEAAVEAVTLLQPADVKTGATQGKGAAAPAPKKGGPGAGSAQNTKSPDGGGADDATAERTDPVTERKRELLRARTRLWYTVLTLAWTAPSDLELARYAAERIVCRQWTRRGDRDMRIMQANAHARLAESYVIELERRGGLFIGQRSFTRRASSTTTNNGGGATDTQDEDAPEDAKADAEQAALIGSRIAAVTAAVKPLHSHLTKMAAIGVELCAAGWEDSWIVLNAATMAWNTHMRAMQSNDYVTGLPVIEAVFQALLQVNTNPKKECALIRDVGAAYVKGLQQAYLRDRHNLSDSVDDTERLARMEFPKAVPAAAGGGGAAAAAEASTHPRLVRALEVCEKMITLLPAPMEAMDFVFAAVAIRYWQAKPVDARTMSQLKVLSAIAQLSFAPGVEERRAIATAAIDALASDPNIELCTKLAEPCMLIPGFERMTLRICAIGQGLYNEGLLGQRQADTSAALLGGAKGAGGGTGGAKPGDAKSKAAAAAAAAAAAENASALAAAPPPASDTDWLWYALLLQYQGVATVALINPSLQSKSTQIGIRKQALSAFTNAAIASLRSPPELRGKVALKCIRLYAANLDDASTAAVRLGLLPSLKRLLSEKVLNTIAPKSNDVDGAPSDFDALGALFIVLARALRDSRKTDDGLAVMRTALKVLPASHHRPFWDLDVELRCAANMPLNATLLRVKEYSPPMQARVWLAVARCAQSIDDQRYAFCNAARALQSNHPAEHGQCMLAFAQWMLKVNDRGVTLTDLRSFVLAAVDGVADRIDAPTSGGVAGFNDAASVRTLGAASDFGDDPEGGLRGSRSATHRQSDATQIRSNASSRASLTASAAQATPAPKKTAGEPKANVPSFFVAIQAYALLASIAGSQAVAVDEVPMDRRSTALMAAYYVSRLWDLLTSAANANILKARARQARNEARAAQIAAAAQATAAAAAAGSPGGAAAAAAKKKASRVVQLPDSATAARGGATTNNNNAESGQQPVVVELISIPRTTDGWLGFKIPPALTQQLQTMSKSLQSINTTTVEEPDIAVAALWHLSEVLVTADLPIHAIPALQLILLIGDLMLPPGIVLNTLKNAVLSQCSTIALRIGAGEIFGCYRLGQLHPTVLEKAALAEDTSMAAATLREVNQQQQNGSASSLVDPRIDLAPANRVRSVYNNWMHMARALIVEGRLSGARDLLREAAEHAEQLADGRAVAKAALLNAKILILEGRFAVAKNEVLRGLAADESLTLGELAEGYELHATVLGHLGQHEAAIQAGFGFIQAVDSRLSTSVVSGLEGEVARATLPDHVIALTSSIADLVISYVRSLSKISVSSESMRLLEQTRALLAAARRFDGVPTQLLLLEAQIERLTITFLPQQHFKSISQALARESHLLHRATEELRSLVEAADCSDTQIDSKSISWRLPAQLRLGLAMAELARNVADRVALRHRLLATYRSSNVTEVDFPHVEGADAKLESKVVNFMRSTQKERKAALRREAVAAQRARVEEQRAAARIEKQKEVERRREARKLEELAGKGPKDAKKPGTKGGAPVADPDPDVDPQDNCGIPSPGGSDDDGSGEDTHDEEVRELQHAILSTTTTGHTTASAGAAEAPPSSSTALPSDHAIAYANIDSGFVASISASELCEEWGLSDNANAAHRWLAYSTVGWETRKALLEGTTPYPPPDESVLQRDKWRRTIDTTGLEEKDDKVGGAAAAGGAGGPGGAGKKPDPKASVATKKDTTAAAAAPVTTAVKSATPPIRFPQNRRPPHVPLAIASAERALINAYQSDDAGSLSVAAFELVELFGFNSDTLSAAGHCIAVACAARNALFIADTWAYLCQPELTDAALYRTLSSLRQGGVHHTQQAQYIAKYLFQNCKLLNRLRLPEAAIGRFQPSSSTEGATSPLPAAPPAAAAAAATTAQAPASSAAQGGGFVSPVQLPAGDVASLSVVFNESIGTVYAVLHRPGVAGCDIRRSALDVTRIAKAEQLSEQFAEAKRLAMVRAAAAGQDVTEEQSARLEGMFTSHVIAPARELLSGLLKPFEPLLDMAGPRWHVVLNVDPRLQFLPWETLPLFARAKSVSRDLSIFTVISRLQRRAAERYSSAAGVTFIVDVCKEHPTAVSALFAPDEQPRNTQWSLLVSGGDDDKKKNPYALSLPQVQRALVTGNPSTVFFHVCGALANTLAPRQWLGLELGHVRLAVMLDHAVNAASSRRENKANVTKPAKQLYLEVSGWATALLLLARGCECVVTSNSQRVVSLKTLDSMGKCLVTALERQGAGPRHFAELVKGHLHRGVPVVEGSKRQPLPPPAEGDAFGLWNAPGSDRFSFSVFGLSPDESSAAAPAEKTTKK